jgi:hypothetical protein
MYFEIFSDIWFLLETLLNFFTPFYSKGVLVIDKKSIAMHYIKSWFILDIVTSFPYSTLYLIQITDEKSQLGRIRLRKYTRVIRLLSILKVNRAF